MNNHDKINNVLATLKMEGLIVSDEIIELGEDMLNGDITSDEMRKIILDRYGLNE